MFHLQCVNKMMQSAQLTETKVAFNTASYPLSCPVMLCDSCTSTHSEDAHTLIKKAKRVRNAKGQRGARSTSNAMTVQDTSSSLMIHTLVTGKSLSFKSSNIPTTTLIGPEGLPLLAACPFSAAICEGKYGSRVKSLPGSTLHIVTCDCRSG